PNACPGSPCVDTTANTGTINGVTGFSDWTLGEQSGPTAVEDVELDATGYDEGTFISWRTGSEVDNLGFNIYREDGNKRVQVNPQVVAGSALITGSGVRLGAGKSYGWWDSDSKNRPGQYWIEDIDLNGNKTLHGPVSVKHIGGAPAARSSAALLSQGGGIQSGVTRPLDLAASRAVTRPDPINTVNTLAAQQAVKIAVKREGFYRVAGADLIAAGLDPKANPDKLQIYADGRQVPIDVRTDQQNHVAAVEFYGIG